MASRNVVLTALLAFSIVVASVRAQVVELTGSTFEHQTQASSGQTTGKWFVKFFAPWCGHCKRLEPVWEQAAVEVQEQERFADTGVIFARVDCTAHRTVCQRFDIRSYPTLKYIADGQIFTYKGQRNLDDILDFAHDGYKNSQGEPVPKPPSFMTQLVESTNFLKVTMTDFDHIMAKRKNAAVMLLLLGFFWGIFFAGFLSMCFGNSSKDDDNNSRPEQDDSKSKKE